MSYITNPLVVREVKNTLSKAAITAGVYGATGVVDALMGSLWGGIVSRTNSREMLNFLSELSSRTLTTNQAKVFNNIVRVTNPKFNNSSIKNLGTSKQAKINKALVGNNNHNLPKPNPPKQLEAPKNTNMSLLEEAVLGCSVPRDFGIKDVFANIKALFNSKKSPEIPASVIQGCYEFLEENGFEAYPIMLDILNRKIAENPVNKDEEVIPRQFSDEADLVTDDDINSFIKVANKYSSLSAEDKKKVDASLENSCGSLAKEFPRSVDKYLANSLTRSDILYLKIMGVLALVLSTFKWMFHRENPNLGKKV